MPAPTIKDIAKRAKVSTATVSYVVNGTRSVSSELTERVVDAIADLGYSPNANARSLRQRRTQTIGLISPDNTNPFFAEIAKGIEDAGFEAGYSVVLCNSNASLERSWEAKDIAFALVAGAPDADPGEVKRAEQAALAEFPTAKPQTIDDFKAEQNKQVDTLVGLVYALLSLSVIVALLGIVNTLALSVHERTRELGLLRAVGMSRRQVRRMVRAESVITAAIGALLGIVLGIAFAAIVSRPLAEDGFVFEMPVVTLVVVTALAALAGVLAAIPPARRASRVDVLRAVTTE